MASKASTPPTETGDKDAVLKSIKDYIRSLEEADTLFFSYCNGDNVLKVTKNHCEAYSNARKTWNQVIDKLGTDVYWPLFWEIQKEAFNAGFYVFSKCMHRKCQASDALACAHKAACEKGYTASLQKLEIACRTRIKKDVIELERAKDSTVSETSIEKRKVNQCRLRLAMRELREQARG